MNVAILGAAVALLAADPISAGRTTNETLVIKVADQIRPARISRQHPRRRTPPATVDTSAIYPAARESVAYPRSPLCADRPYRHTWWTW
jgi:hypothetical protein